MHPPFVPLPKTLQPLYQKLRITLWIVLFFLGSGLVYTFLFPIIRTSFDFQNPNSSKNLIFDPRSDMGTLRQNGKLETGGKLIVNTSPVGDFSRLTINIDLENDSESPAEIYIAIRKNYRAFLFPAGPSVDSFPPADLYRVENTYYQLIGESLRPFVSPAAFHSRYLESAAKTADAAWQNQHLVTNDFIGFRVGSLVSFADGIFVITSETEMRPIGSAEIFLELGYNFRDVIPGSEEDIGIYKRGRILLLGAPHPDGTIFKDESSGTYFLIASGERRPISAGPYLDFLISRIHPITADAPNEKRTVSCGATASLLPRSLECSVDLRPVGASFGPDYEVSIEGSDVNIDINTLSLDFETRLDAANAQTLFSKLKARLLARFGLAPTP